MATTPMTTGAHELASFGVQEGADVILGTPEWLVFVPEPNMVLEFNLQNSSLPMVPYEAWAAVLVGGVDMDEQGGYFVTGPVLGCEAIGSLPDVEAIVRAAGLHLCGDDPCGLVGPDGKLHVTQVRGWTIDNFQASYLSAAGKKALKAAVKVKKEMQKKSAPLKAKEKKGPKKKPAAAEKEPGKGILKRRVNFAPEAEVIDLEKEEEAEEAEEDPGSAGKGISRERQRLLRETLQSAKARMIGGGVKSVRGRDNLGAGLEPALSNAAVERPAMTTGSHLSLGQGTPLSLVAAEDIRDGGSRALKKKVRSKISKEPGSALLAQAVKTAQVLQGEKRRRKKKDKVEKLLELLGGSKKEKKASRKQKKRRKVKPDPEDPYGGDNGDSGEESSESEYAEEDTGSESDSDLSFEAPLRKKAAKEPGSVMKLLIKHAQEQMDRGQILDQNGTRGDITTGIKVSTYFALLIRPYYNNNSPLLRELYALAQTIDQLRSGLLMQTADSLASRFIAVHCALSEGGWSTASQLEMFPLEAVQSAGTATMLAAQKHKKMVLKSQGNYYPQQNWWGQGKGRGNQKGEKGKKGDFGKGKGPRKGKGNGGKDGNWWQKGENPWAANRDDAAKKTPEKSG